MTDGTALQGTRPKTHAVNGPNDEAKDEPLPPVPGPRTRPPRRSGLLRYVLEPARHATNIIVVAYVLAIVGLTMPLLTGLDGSVTVLGASVGLLFLSFLALFYCTLTVTSTTDGSGDDRRRR